MLNITETAKEEILKVLKENVGKKLRVLIQGMGWGGPNFGLSLDETKEKDDVLNFNGIDVLLGEEEKMYLTDSIIDFEDSQMGKGFSIRPVQNSACC